MIAGVTFSSMLFPELVIVFVKIPPLTVFVNFIVKDQFPDCNADEFVKTCGTKEIGEPTSLILHL